MRNDHSLPRVIERFDGSCEPFAAVSAADLVSWIGGIPFQDWPQQRRNELRPAMVNDLSWHGFGTMAAPIVEELMQSFPGCEPHQPMLSVVMPGHSIEPHTDQQPPSWRCRVHIPLTTNGNSRFVVGGVAHRMQVGTAYRVNTEAEHAVTNDGTTPRVHFMFDVRVAA